MAKGQLGTGSMGTSATQSTSGSPSMKSTKAADIRTHTNMSPKSFKKG